MHVCDTGMYHFKTSLAVESVSLYVSNKQYGKKYKLYTYFALVIQVFSVQQEET